MSPKSQAQLAAALTSESALDIRSLYAAEVDYVWTSLRRLGVSGPDLEDLAHDTFVSAFRQLDTCDQGRPLRPWLFGIAFRVVTDLRKLAHPTREAADEPVEHGEATEARSRVSRALDVLELERRAVFVMHEIDGCPIPHVASVLKTPLNTAYSRLRLARAQFAEAVAKLAGESAAGMSMFDGSGPLSSELRTLLRHEQNAPPVPSAARERVRLRLEAAVLLGGLGLVQGAANQGASEEPPSASTGDTVHSGDELIRGSQSASSGISGATHAGQELARGTQSAANAAAAASGGSFFRWSGKLVLGVGLASFVAGGAVGVTAYAQLVERRAPVEQQRPASTPPPTQVPVTAPALPLDAPVPLPQAGE